MEILVLCTGNSARSILLEGILASMGYGAHSAGSKPVGRVNPVAIDTLAAHGITLDNPQSKSWDVFAQMNAPALDLVITVCGNAAGETCPIWPTKAGVSPLRVHWGVEDPTGAADEPAAFAEAFEVLHHRALAFDALKDKRDPDALLAIGGLMPSM